MFFHLIHRLSWYNKIEAWSNFQGRYNQHHTGIIRHFTRLFCSVWVSLSWHQHFEVSWKLRNQLQHPHPSQTIFRAIWYIHQLSVIFSTWHSLSLSVIKLKKKKLICFEQLIRTAINCNQKPQITWWLHVSKDLYRWSSTLIYEQEMEKEQFTML